MTTKTTKTTTTKQVPRRPRVVRLVAPRMAYAPINQGRLRPRYNRRRVVTTAINRVRRLRQKLNNPKIGNNSFSTNKRTPSAVPPGKLTAAGMSFLKCAFAPPDFTSTGVKGVPDDFRGTTLLKKHRLNGTVNFTSANDTYFLLSPVPGIAYFYCSTTAGTLPISTSVWIGVPYSDFTALFTSSFNTTASLVTSFRFISNHIELVSTTNQMNWSGSIQSWKIPIKAYIMGTSAAANHVYGLSGLEGVTSTNSNRYVGPFNEGFFAGCYNSASTFTFNPIIEGQNNLPDSVVSTIDFGQLQGTPMIPGLANDFETMVIKVSGVTGNQSAIIRTWACVEYTANPASSIYEYSSDSPPEDETALKLYREVALSLPIGVPFRMNDTFWQRVLQIMRTITAAGSNLPGPYGMISSGVNTITNGIYNLSY